MSPNRYCGNGSSKSSLTFSLSPPWFAGNYPGNSPRNCPGLRRWRWWQRTRLPMQETQEMWVGSPSQEDPLEAGTATHSSILTWKISWTELGGPQSIGSQRVRRNLARTHILVLTLKISQASRSRTTLSHTWILFSKMNALIINIGKHILKVESKVKTTCLTLAKSIHEL